MLIENSFRDSKTTFENSDAVYLIINQILKVL